MYDPVAISQYGQIRHEELVREAEAYWRVELERKARGETFRAHAPRKAGPLNWITHLLTALHR
jgi:hypothetical protein